MAGRSHVGRWIGVSIAAAGAIWLHAAFMPAIHAGSGTSVNLSQESGIVGTSLGVTGAGFPPSATFALYFDQPTAFVVSPARVDQPGAQTDAQGNFALTITVPYLPFGPHQVCADTGYPGSVEGVQVKACAQFNVVPTLRLSPIFGQPGSSFMVAGSGFPAGETVGFYADAPQSGTIVSSTTQVDASGFFTFELTWSATQPASPGWHDVCADTSFPKVGQAILVMACAQFEVEAPPTV